MTRVAKKGYSIDPSWKARPYKVQMSINGKTKYIGNYATAEEAIAVYKKVRAENPMMPAHNGFRHINENGLHKSGYVRAPEARCKFCGEYRSVKYMERHVRSCKWRNVDKI